MNYEKEIEKLKTTVAAQATQITYSEPTLNMHRDMLEDLSRQVDSKI